MNYDNDFHRKQLINTYDMVVQSKIRDILATNKIDYTINSVIAGFGSVQAEYKIYVHKNDYEYACHLIKDAFRHR